MIHLEEDLSYARTSRKLGPALAGFVAGGSLINGLEGRSFRPSDSVWERISMLAIVSSSAFFFSAVRVPELSQGAWRNESWPADVWSRELSDSGNFRLRLGLTARFMTTSMICFASEEMDETLSWRSEISWSTLRAGAGEVSRCSG